MKRKLLNYLIRHLTRNYLAALTEEDILTMSNRGWFLNKRKLSQEEIAELKDEAQALKDSVLWRLMMRDIKYSANVRMFEKGSIDGNNIFGRAMLYNLELLNSFIENCRKL